MSLSKAPWNHLFNFYLSKEKAPPSNFSTHPAIFSLGPWTLTLSNEMSLKSWPRKSAKKIFYIGTIFEFDFNKPEHSIGHYLAFEFDPETSTLLIFRSRNSPLGVYYSKKSVAVWGDCSWLKESTEINEDALSDFKKTGLISHGNTLYKDVFQLPFQKQLSIKDDNSFVLLNEDSLQHDISLLQKPKSLCKFVLWRISEWLSHCQFHSLALSGGLDSRFIYAALKITRLPQDVTIHTRTHPHLDSSKNADVLLSQQMAAHLKRPHHLQSVTNSPFSYLGQEPPARFPIFSGLYGGEWLGGEILNWVSDDSLDKDREDSFSQLLSLTAQMFTCDFYEGAWAHCHLHHNLAITPFWDSHLMALLLNTPTDIIKQYRLYKEIFKELPDFFKTTPTVSLLAHYYPEWDLPLPGLNPKTIPWSSSPTLDLNVLRKQYGDISTARLTTLHSLIPFSSKK